MRSPNLRELCSHAVILRRLAVGRRGGIRVSARFLLLANVPCRNFATILVSSPPTTRVRRQKIAMLPDPNDLVRQISELHAVTIDRWHASPPDNPHTGLPATVCQQHQFNFLLWHEEDIARSPDVSDSHIATVKRSIDRYNQQRNDAIEMVDEASARSALRTKASCLAAGARLNTETPGSVIDRLSIMSLRIYHFEEQLTRAGADAVHRANVSERLIRCRMQHADLSRMSCGAVRRHLVRPKAAQSLSPDEDVQRSIVESVFVSFATPGRLGLVPRGVEIGSMPIPISQCRSPRRVLQVITPSRMSGAETQLVRMTARLQSRGHSVATLVKTRQPGDSRDAATWPQHAVAASFWKVQSRLTGRRLPRSLGSTVRTSFNRRSRPPVGGAVGSKVLAARLPSGTCKGSPRRRGIAINLICSRYRTP